MSDHDPNERWKPCPGLEDWYSVSNLGRVRRDVTTPCACAGTILNPSPQTCGYLCVQLFKGKKPRICRLVHRLVAQAFLEPPTHGRAHVNHKDGARTNNRADNLEWCTPMENVRHAIEVLGYNPSERIRASVPRGDKHYRAILTQAQADDIRAEWERSGHTMNQRAAGREYGVKRGAISALVHGKSWKG